MGIKLGHSFRPLTGPTISQYGSETVKESKEESFRPLTGPTISQLENGG